MDRIRLGGAGSSPEHVCYSMHAVYNKSSAHERLTANCAVLPLVAQQITALCTLCRACFACAICMGCRSKSVGGPWPILHRGMHEQMHAIIQMLQFGKPAKMQLTACDTAVDAA